MTRNLLPLILLAIPVVACADLPEAESPTAGPAAATTSNLAAALEVTDDSGDSGQSAGAPTLGQQVERPSSDAKTISEDAEELAGPVATQTSGPGTGPPPTMLRRPSQTAQRPPSRATWQREPTPWYRNGLFSLAIVLVVIAGAAYLIRKLVPSVRTFNGGAIEVLGRSQLTPKQSLALVRVGQRVVLIGISAERLSTLCEIDRPEEVAELLVHSAGGRSGSPGGRDARFDELLGEAADEFKEAPRGLSETVPGRSEPLDRARGKVQGLIGRLKAMQQRG